MKQRVVIAMSLMGDPALIVADEPTTALDVTVQAEILDLLRALQAETGMAILLVTHDWGVVADFCSRAVTMYAGQVVERATIEDLFRLPTHPYTRALLDSSPDRARPGEPIVAIPGQVPAASDWPRGCHFHDRCAFAQPDCREEPIPMTATGAGRESRCIHVDDLLAAHVERAG
jgi:peptide/nickel transport system permease protein